MISFLVLNSGCISYPVSWKILAANPYSILIARDGLEELLLKPKISID